MLVPNFGRKLSSRGILTWTVHAGGRTILAPSYVMTVISGKIFTYKSHGTEGETDSSIRGPDDSTRPVKSKGSKDSKGPVSALMKGALDTNRLAGPMESALRLPAVLLGICFLVLFSGFSTLSNLQVGCNFLAI